MRNWCQRVTNLIVTGTQGTTIQTLRGWLLHTKALNSQALNTQQNFRTDLKACFREMVCIIFSTVTTITTSRCRHLSSRLSLSPQFVADAAVVAVAVEQRAVGAGVAGDDGSPDADRGGAGEGALFAADPGGI